MTDAEFSMEEDMSNSSDDISALTLTPRWQFDTYGMSTVTRSLVNNLRLVDPDGEMIKLTCAVLEEEGKIAKDQLKMLRNMEFNSEEQNNQEARKWNQTSNG